MFMNMIFFVFSSSIVFFSHFYCNTVHQLLMYDILFIKFYNFSGSGGALPSSRPHPLSMEAACADGTPPPPLQIGDRVVWISDSGPEYGEVKWLGKLLDVGTEWMVGVEFVSSIYRFIYYFK